MLNIAQNIQQLRIEAGMTQESLAHYLGLTKATVSKWENHISYPDIRYLPVLANLFNTMASFIRLSESTGPSTNQ